MNAYTLPKLIGLFGTLLILATSCTKTVTDDGAPGSGGDSGGTPQTFNVTVSTIAGKVNDQGDADGNGTDARFWNPTKMVYDDRNNTLYVADGSAIRSIDAQNNVTTYMSPFAISRYSEILDMALAPGAGGSLYIITAQQELVRVESQNGELKKTLLASNTYGGNDVGALNTIDQFDGTNGLTTGPNGEIYFFNTFWNTMHRLTFTSFDPVAGTVEPFVGKPLQSRSDYAWPLADGQGEAATFGGQVYDMAADGQGNIYVGDLAYNELRMVTPDGHVKSMLLYKYPNYGEDVDGPIATARGNGVAQIACSHDGTFVFFSTYGDGGWHKSPALRVMKDKKDVLTLVHSHFEGDQDGSGDTAILGTVGGLACRPDGKTIYVAEPYSKVIRKVTIQ